MNYLIGLIGLTGLCAIWMVFQLWLKRVDPERQGFRPGCGACQGGSCQTATTSTEITITPEKLAHRPE